MSHVSIPLIRGGGASLSHAPFTGYGLETKVISDCVWTFTIIRGLIKEVYRKKHIFLLWVSEEGHNEQTLSFSTDD